MYINNTNTAYTSSAFLTA